MGTFKYVMRDACRQLVRHWGVTLLTLVTAAAVFFLVGASALFSLSVGQIASRVESDQVVRAFAESEGAALSIKNSLASVPGVAKVELKTPDQALEVLRARMGAQSQVITMAGENPMPWTVEVTVARSSQVSEVARALSSNPQVSDFIYAGALAERLGRVSRLATRVSGAVVVLALLVSGLVLYNTLRLAIDHRRREVSVMLLVGSTKAHIMAPFVLQGMILGLLGALVACLGLVPAYSYAIGELNREVVFLNLHFDRGGLVLLCEFLLLGGLALGWLCSFLAVNHRIRTASRPL